MASRKQRRIFFVDKQVQTALIVRAARYWVLSLLVVGTLSILGWMFLSPGMPALIELRQHLPALLGGFAVSLLASMIVLPVVLYDLVRMSNRFVGPMVRLLRGMKQAAAGKDVEPIQFRDGDFWPEFAEAFNKLNDRLQIQESQLQKAKKEFQEESSLLPTA